MGEKMYNFRNKISIISLILSIGVVYQHTQWGVSEQSLFTPLYTCFFYVIQNCVPFFFMMSGYLFFRTISPENVKTKIKSRIKTLCIPYLIWNILYAVFMISLFKLGFIHALNVENGIFGILKQIINAEFSPLWFVKYLMIFTLISPLSYIIFKRKHLGLLTIGIIWITNALNYHYGIISTPLNVNSNSLAMLNYQYIYYAIGIWTALHIKEYIESYNRNRTIFSSIVLILLLIMSNCSFYNRGDILVSHSFRLLFICCLWFALDFIEFKELKGNYSFFIYCLHMIPLQCTQAILHIVMEKLSISNNIIYLLEYIILPIVIVVITIYIAKFIKKYIPKISILLTGGRL